MNIGIVVEDERDAVAYSELIKKIRNDVSNVHPIPCRGSGSLKKEFVHWLRYFEWFAPGSIHSISKALVILDSDCSDASVWEERLRTIYLQSHFAPSFPVRFHATKCELETWLLADENAINEVCISRGKNRRIGPAKIEFESYRPAKELFQKRLSDVGLPFDTQVYKEVAAHIDIARITVPCRNFQDFIDKVRIG
jgi:hypothetical protein